MLKVKYLQLTKFQGKANEAIVALTSGENFADVAKKFSEDKARNGGLLGWMQKGQLTKIFEEAAFKLSTSSIQKPIYTNPPIKTEFGYHIIMIEKDK